MLKNSLFVGVLAVATTLGVVSSATASILTVGGSDYEINDSVPTLTSTDASFEYDLFGLNNVFTGPADFDASPLSLEFDLGFSEITIFDENGDVRDELTITDLVADETTISAVFEIVGLSSPDFANGGILQLFDFDVAVQTGEANILEALDRSLFAQNDDVLGVQGSATIYALAGPAVVPLPASGLLLLTAFGGLVLRRRIAR